jgi:hypothetical protein
MRTLLAWIGLVSPCLSPLSCRCSRHACRQNRSVLHSRLAPVLGLCALTSACSLLFDAKRMQCVTDSDCRALALVDGICIDNICQQPEPSSSEDAAGAGIGGTADPNSAAMSEAASAGGLRSNAPAMNNAGRTPEADGGSATMSAGSSGTAGAAATPGSQPTCSGANCECSVDADCGARGVASGVCVEGRCWEPESQCQADDECAARGPEYVGGRCQDRQCLPNPRWRCDPPPQASPSDSRELVLPVIDALQRAALANVTIVACNKLDYPCMQPMATATTGMDGKARLSVPANFAGFMQQTERTDYVHSMYFMPALLLDDGVLSNFPLIPTAAFGGLAIALGTNTDPERGHAMLIVEDCGGDALPGIAFTSPQADMATTTFYVRDQIPTTSASDTPPEGDGGYVNLPPGVAEITATEVATGLVINTVTVLIRAGAITTAYIRPASRGTTVTGRFPLGPRQP